MPALEITLSFEIVFSIILLLFSGFVISLPSESNLVIFAYPLPLFPFIILVPSCVGIPVCIDFSVVQLYPKPSTIFVFSKE